MEIKPFEKLKTYQINPKIKQAKIPLDEPATPLPEMSSRMQQQLA